MRLAVTVPEAAEMIGVSESMLWKLLERGDLSRVKIGRRSVIRIAELERFLTDSERNEAASVQETAPHVTLTDTASGDGRCD